MDMTASIAAKSDQQNAEDYLAGPKTVTISEVRAGSSDQPVEIHLAEFPGKPFKPSKTDRRKLVAAWGVETREYVGRRMTLYRDPDVKWAGEKVGGIRISHLSHIDKPLSIALTETRGKKSKHVIQPLTEAAPSAPAPDTSSRASKAVEWFAAKGVSVSNLEAHVGKPIAEWDDADLAALKTDSDAIVGDES